MAVCAADEAGTVRRGRPRPRRTSVPAGPLPAAASDFSVSLPGFVVFAFRIMSYRRRNRLMRKPIGRPIARPRLFFTVSKLTACLVNIQLSSVTQNNNSKEFPLLRPVDYLEPALWLIQNFPVGR